MLLGLSLLIDGPGPLPLPEHLFTFLGLAAVAGGQFVFMVLVADRAFSRASRRLTFAAELVAFAAFVIGLGATMVLVWEGASG